MLTRAWRVANIFCALKKGTEVAGIVRLRISLQQVKGEQSTRMDWHAAFNLPKGKRDHNFSGVLNDLPWIEFTRGWGCGWD